jgi:hypothetical protein
VSFKDFITKQRAAIFVLGIAVFIGALVLSHIIGFDSLWGELFIDLATSAVTIVFTALIIDYLNVREQSMKTMNAAGLAESEIRAICLRIKWRMARLFGMEQNLIQRDQISDQHDALQYLEKVTNKVDNYLSEGFDAHQEKMDEKSFQKYLERLQSSQNELEQTLILYEYALSYSLRECILALRRELQTADRLLGFIDNSEELNEANRSLIKVTAQSIYDSVEEVMSHTSTSDGEPIHAKAEQIRKG